MGIRGDSVLVHRRPFFWIAAEVVAGNGVGGGAAEEVRTDLEMAMPALDASLLERKIEFKYNTGWFKGAIIAVADGTDAYKFECKCSKGQRKKCTGRKHIVPVGWVKAHFFDDDADEWVQLRQDMLNGRAQGGWRLLRA